MDVEKLTNAELEQGIKHFIEVLQVPGREYISSMLQPCLISCDAEKLEAVVGFPGASWETNLSGVIHGGIVATMLDTGIGILIAGILGKVAPTINMQVSYLRPCPADGTLAVTAHITMFGGSVVHTRGELWDTREPGKIVATAEAVYRRFK